MALDNRVDSRSSSARTGDRPSTAEPDGRRREARVRPEWFLWPVIAVALLMTVQAWNASPSSSQEASPADSSRALAGRLGPTAHPPVPATLDTMWYVRQTDQAPSSAVLANLVRGVRLLEESNDAAAALPLLTAPALEKTEMADVARYYAGLALQRLNRLDDADAVFAVVAARPIPGPLPNAALYRQAEIREGRKDFAGAAALYERLLEQRLATPPLALVKLGAASSAAGNRRRAIEAHRRVLAEFPLAPEAAEAERLLDGLDGWVLDTPEAVRAELDRAERLYAARRWDQARSAFSRVADRVAGVEADRVTIRLAQIQAARGQHRQAREVFRRFVGHDTLGADAQYGLIVAARESGDEDQFTSLTRTFVGRYPESPLAEDALNELARHYILKDEDGKAAAVFTDMVARFPKGARAERAAWKAGWWAYRQKNFRETVRLYDAGAATFPRSDYRPSWLYWSGRAHDQLGDTDVATERYRLVVSDYRNTYYGRLAERQLEARQAAPVSPGVRRVIVTAPPPPPTSAHIARLVELGLYRMALTEIEYAQKVWGDSAPLQATLALVHNRLGNLRPGINAMKRAYPQYMAAGGEDLPEEILRVLFPVDYWALLKGHAEARGLDPYIVAALVAQESTFDAAIRSSANAIGLMQVLPSTGRRVGRQIGIHSVTAGSLTNPEINVRIGTQYFADLVRRFGGHHFALASYNAGENRVQRWLNEAPGLPQDEWVDNIPFPETQNYVKRVLGTAEDYRRLYGTGHVPANAARPAARAAPAAKKSPATKTAPKKAPPKKTTTKKAAPKKTTASKRR